MSNGWDQQRLGLREVAAHVDEPTLAAFVKLIEVEMLQYPGASPEALALKNLRNCSRRLSPRGNAISRACVQGGVRGNKPPWAKFLNLSRGHPSLNLYHHACPLFAHVPSACMRLRSTSPTQNACWNVASALEREMLKIKLREGTLTASSNCRLVTSVGEKAGGVRVTPPPVPCR